MFFLPAFLKPLSRCSSNIIAFLSTSNLHRINPFSLRTIQVFQLKGSICWLYSTTTSV